MHNYVHVYKSKFDKKQNGVVSVYDRSECRTEGCRDVSRFPSLTTAPISVVIAMHNSRQEWAK